MKIVDRKTFLAMPANTLYSKYESCNFGDIHIKGETCYSVEGGAIDFLYYPIADAIAHDDTDQFVDALNCAQRTGCSLLMDFNSSSRDGLFDENQLFAVWEMRDIGDLTARLSRCYSNHRKEIK